MKELANADQNRLDDMNRCVKQFQDDILGLERAFHLRESLANQLKIKIDGLDKIHDEQQSEVGLNLLFNLLSLILSYDND